MHLSVFLLCSQQLSSWRCVVSVMADFGQTDFGQFWCFIVFWPNPKKPNPKDPNPRPWERGWTLRGPPFTPFGPHLFWVWRGCGHGKHHENSTRRHPESHRKSAMVAGGLGTLSSESSDRHSRRLLHDEGLWRCMCEILRVPLDTGVLARDTASLPLALGGLGLRSAVRSRQSAYWASWADTLPMVRLRHRAIAESFVEALVTGVGPVFLVEAEDCLWNLTGVMGFEPPSWPALAAGARPPPPPWDDPGGWRTGWQHEAASRVERHFRDTSLMPRLNDTEEALLRSQSGPMSGAALSTAPACFHTRIESHLFRLLLLRRLRLPLPPCVPVCRCGRPLDSFGHHRAACPRAGLFARRGFAVEMAAAKVCQEAGARVTTNVVVRDLDLGVPQPALDGRRLEVVAEGLPLFPC